jgi:hypothetical protein
MAQVQQWILARRLRSMIASTARSLCPQIS